MRHLHLQWAAASAADCSVPSHALMQGNVYILQVGVYAALGIGNSLNKYQLGIGAKILASLAVIFVFWDLK